MSEETKNEMEVQSSVETVDAVETEEVTTEVQPEEPQKKKKKPNIFVRILKGILKAFVVVFGFIFLLLAYGQKKKGSSYLGRANHRLKNKDIGGSYDVCLYTSEKTGPIMEFFTVRKSFSITVGMLASIKVSGQSGCTIMIGNDITYETTTCYLTFTDGSEVELDVINAKLYNFELLYADLIK